MSDRELLDVLAWALPQLGLRWSGFHGLHRQVCRRIRARARSLGLASAAAYRARLAEDRAELAALDALCFVTISRFYRDAPTFDALATRVLPDLAAAAVARDETPFRVWSAGAASGEEPYTMALLWSRLALPLALQVLATERDGAVLARAARAVYPASSLRELPADLRAAFTGVAGGFTLAPSVREAVRFVQADLRTFAPDEPHHVVLCRNVVFTYFDEAAQRAFLSRLRLVEGGVLVLGKNETLPADSGFVPTDAPWVYVRAS